MSKLPIARLHDDALALIFSAVLENGSFSSQKLSLALPVTLSHVCRRWRAVTLAQPRLWAMFCWKPGDNVEAALTVLHRSGAAALFMNVDIRLELGDNSGPGMPDWHSILGAIIAHLWRVSNLRLSLGRDSLLFPSVQLLFDSVPFKMPRLHGLSITVPTGVRRIPRLNLECPPLSDISLSRVIIRAPFHLVGPETTTLDFNDLEIAFSELHAIFSLATDLRRFSLTYCEVVDDSPGVAALQNVRPLSPPRLDEVNIVSGPASTPGLLRKLLSNARAREVGVYTFRTEIPPPVALAFLDVGKLGNIHSLEISRDTLQFKNVTGMERNLGGELGSFEFLRNVVADQQLFSSLRKLQTNLECWMDLMRLFSHAGRRLLNLEEVRLLLSQDGYVEDNTPFDGDRIFAPCLRSIRVNVYGKEMPAPALVQHYIRALCCFLPSSLAGATVTYDDEYSDDALVDRFLELYQLEQSLVMTSWPIPQFRE